MAPSAPSTVSEPSDTVILHCPTRGKTIPAISPFVLKLETYLRMTKIPYKIDTTKPFGPNGKTPWITLNGVVLTDSQLIIEFLNKKFNKDEWGNTTPEQKAMARTIRVMMEEHMFWGFVRWRFFEGVSKFPEIYPISGFEFKMMKWFITGRINKALHSQGLGRHSYDTIIRLASEDLRDLSVLLGDKPFIMGDEPVEADCAIFGSLGQILWGGPGSPFQNLVENELTNLKEYALRMKNRFWPDWDEILTK